MKIVAIEILDKVCNTIQKEFEKEKKRRISYIEIG